MLKSDAEKLMRELIQRIAVGPNRGRDISESQAESAMRAILAKQINDVQVAVFLIALRMKRESIAEFTGLFKAMQQSVVRETVPVKNLFGLVDPFDGYLRCVPVSPFVPAVLASCGLHSVAYGLETVGPKHGVTAHKVYRAAGMNTLLTQSQASNCIAENGWAYLDQKQYAPSLYDMIDLRDCLVKRTAITTLERLLMPLQGQQNTHLVLGYVHREYPEIYSKIAEEAGYSSALLVKGVEGGYAPALNKPLRNYFYDFSSSDVNDDKIISDVPMALQATDDDVSEVGMEPVYQCLEMGMQALSGRHGEMRNRLVLASANIIYQCRDKLTDNNINLAMAVEKVQNCLDNGHADAQFNLLLN